VGRVAEELAENRVVYKSLKSQKNLVIFLPLSLSSKEKPEPELAT
jgi:hypothetical protein